MKYKFRMAVRVPLLLQKSEPRSLFIPFIIHFSEVFAS